jgi:hypothetical protein
MLLLQRGEEALHRRVVETVAAPAHGLPDPVPLEHLAVGVGGVLHAAVAVQDEARFRPTALQGQDQRVDAELGAQVVRHRPADDLAGRHVLDNGQV